MIDQLSCDRQSNTFLGQSIGEHNRYQIEAQLGKGGMGDVYKALDTRLGKVVAIKRLKTSLNPVSTAAELDIKRRFERECAICAALNNKHVVQVSDYGITAEGHPFYVMEYLEGQTLKQVLKEELRLPVERAIGILMQICAGLKSVHEGVIFKTPDNCAENHIKIVHRDLKPANIFIVQSIHEDQVKIIDFGAAKIQSPHLDKVNLGNFFLGTYHYAAPEQFEGEDKIDARTDIYCLGIVLYEMLTGIDPYGLTLQGQSVTGKCWIDAHLHKVVQPLRSRSDCNHLSEELEDILMRCLAKNPAERFPSIQALFQALEAEQNRLSNRIYTSNSPQRMSKRIIKHFNLSPVIHLLQNVKSEFEEDLLQYSASQAVLAKPCKLLLVDSELINQCQIELLNYIGPIAKIIMEQTLKDVESHQPQKFIEMLSKHIPDPNDAYQFRQTFLASNATG